MSFLTTQPEELAAAAGKLETIGSAMVAQNAAAAAPTTTGVIPAAADEISVLQAPLFTAYGTLYQQVSAEAAAVYDLFVKTLGVSAPMLKILAISEIQEGTFPGVEPKMLAIPDNGEAAADELAASVAA